MIDLEIQLVRQNPACLLVLRAYQTALQQLRDAATAETSSDTSVEDESGAEPEDEATASRRAPMWISRLPSVDGVDDEELSWVHGQLIAYGLLKCDLRDRSAGVVYQLTAEGRQVLEQESGEGHADAA